MSRLLRNMQRQRAQADLDGGWMADPLRLPFMRILEGVKYLNLSEAFRILVTCGACALTAGQEEELYRKGCGRKAQGFNPGMDS
ncbi:MAG: hypothetical protein Q4C89_15070, partial [Deinococcus sp.]|uniref:hypothetical protein n=1 Tax=Deinococcus sp. TaxID=47478 RepID=UPI0026DD0C84